MSTAASRSTPVRSGDPLGEAILAAASEILSEQGAEGLNVRRIAERASTSTMGVYSRFGSKLGVVDALYREGFERLRQETEPLVQSGEPLAALEELALAYRATALANATHYEIMFGHAVTGFAPSPEARSVAREGFDRVVVAAVRRAVEAGLLRGDAVELAFQLWSLVHGMVSLELNGAVPPAPGAFAERRCRRAVRAYLRGVQAQTAEGRSAPA